MLEKALESPLAEGGISTTFADSDSGGAGLSARVRGMLESFRAVGVA